MSDRFDDVLRELQALRAESATKADGLMAMFSVITLTALGIIILLIAA